jgi:hypothetical protein
MLILKLAAVTAAVPAVFAAGLASLDWMVVDVREGGPSGQRIVVPFPLVVARAALAFAPPPAQSVATPPELREAAPMAAAVLDALREAPDAELVRVEQRGETVSIRKEGDSVRVFVENGKETVRVTLPLGAARAALDGASSGHVRTAAILDAIGDADGDLVDVRSGNDHVRVWVW